MQLLRHVGNWRLVLRHLRGRLLEPPKPASPDSINNYYVTSYPSAQNALDIFKDEWSSQLPPPVNHLRVGTIQLFEDARVHWFASEIGGFQNQRVLELGPLEGGHSYMLEQMGAESVTAIEANTRAYLKCLITKEILGLRRVRFLCGDFVEYLRSGDCPQFDIGLASGVLYHMVNPVELIGLLAAHCTAHLLLWTHFYDDAWATRRNLRDKFPFSQPAEYSGFRHTLYRQQYGYAVQWSGFCGGSRPHSNWMERDEIVACLKYFDFANVRIGFDDYDHPNGPSFALVASRQ